FTFFTGTTQTVFASSPTQPPTSQPITSTTTSNTESSTATQSTLTLATSVPPSASLTDSGAADSSGGSSSTRPVQSASADASPHTGTPNIEAIIGSVVGSIVAVALLLLLLFLIRRRRHRTMQRRGDMGEDAFYNNKMVVERRASIDSAGAVVGFGQKRNTGREDSDRDSSLREDFEDRRSAAGSPYPADSAAADRLSTGFNWTLPSIGTTPIETMFGSGGLVESSAPLIPTPVSPAPFQSPSRARTDRQMLVEQKILELQGRLITAKGSKQEKTRVRAMLRNRIEKVKELKESDWALHKGNTGDDVPEILRG
ncbi:hypothetical protein V5O48_017164, partial [Marasmius crinis-equi]